MAPGAAWQSTPEHPVTEMVGPAADLASMLTLGAGAIPAEADALNMGIKAFHGSPYEFQRFDPAKIGTGQGAQTFGHGLYFAENPAVVESYQSIGRSAPPLSSTLGGSANLKILPAACTRWN